MGADADGSPLELDVSADERYVLFVDGVVTDRGGLQLWHIRAKVGFSSTIGG